MVASRKPRVALTTLLAALVLLGCIIPSLARSSWLDSAESRFAAAANRYDANALVSLLGEFENHPQAPRPRSLLLRGLICWRLTLIAFCKDSKPRLIERGKEALAYLEQAQRAGADTSLTAGHRALVCQLLASTGVKNGIVYGPRAASEIKEALAADSAGYFALLAEAVNVSRAPSFAGGDVAEAVVMLENLRRRFPDSVDVRIHLADALGRTGRVSEARDLITPIVDSQPFNLFARKVAEEIK